MALDDIYDSILGFEAERMRGLSAPALPSWLHALLLVGFVLFFCRALVLAVRRFAMPGQHEGRRRLERASGLDHRPLTAVEDSLAAGAGNSSAAELWQQHQRRMADAARQLRVGAPSPGLARYDPRALRTGLALLLVVAVVAGETVTGVDVTDWAAPAGTIPSP